MSTGTSATCEMASRPTRFRVPIAKARFSQCSSRKINYQTKREALDAAEVVMEAGRVSPGCHIMPYICDECGDWHLTQRVIVRHPHGPRWTRRARRV